MDLSAPALRVLGVLVEKAMATPQQYPLSLNALRAACNQTTARDPVVDYDEATVRGALDELRRETLTTTAYARGSRVPKYAHALDRHFEIDDAATAVLGVLLLRGPQTSGELRSRTDRMHAFASIEDVEDALGRLSGAPFGALVEQLARRPGEKQQRWAHLLGGPAGEPEHAAPRAPGAATPADPPRDVPLGGRAPAAPGRAAAPADAVDEVAALRDEVHRLRRLVEDLVARLDDLEG